MFENSGTKIRNYANVLFIISIVAVIICAIVFGRDAYGDFSFGSFILIAVVGILVSYISCLFLSAFGELVENSGIIAYNTEKTVTSNQEIIKRQSSDDYWTCPNCKKSNHKSTGTCGCGTRRPN